MCVVFAKARPAVLLRGKGGYGLAAEREPVPRLSAAPKPNLDLQPLTDSEAETASEVNLVISPWEAGGPRTGQSGAFAPRTHLEAQGVIRIVPSAETDRGSGPQTQNPIRAPSNSPNSERERGQPVVKGRSSTPPSCNPLVPASQFGDATIRHLLPAPPNSLRRYPATFSEGVPSIESAN
jgi:hypothetical protein